MIDKEWSESEIEHWKKFLRTLEDEYVVNSYREGIGIIKEGLANKTIETVMPIAAPQDLEKKEYKEWEEEEKKKLCLLETVKILKVCGQEELIDSNPYVVQHIYKDRLMRNGFVEEEESVSVAQEKSDCPSTDKLTGQENDYREKCDETNLKSDKEATGNIVNNSIAAEQKREEGLSELASCDGQSKPAKPSEYAKRQLLDTVRKIVRKEGYSKLPSHLMAKLKEYGLDGAIKNLKRNTNG